MILYVYALIRRYSPLPNILLLQWKNLKVQKRGDVTVHDLFIEIGENEEHKMITEPLESIPPGEALLGTTGALEMWPHVTFRPDRIISFQSKSNMT